ncbi:MAG: helix-turn-helix domain-containing protein [Nostoc sp.]|uniref:helix-turn-helix domain-containing protein n=1 Tax=Nostoc sp. TaxID=1180 RepID=UPI002FF5445D
MIQQLLEPCDRITYGQRQREVAAKLGKSVRTVRRLVKKWEEEGLAALQTTTRADKGTHRIDTDWQQFIIKTYQEGNKGSKRITPQQVAIRVRDAYRLRHKPIQESGKPPIVPVAYMLSSSRMQF